MITTVKFYNYPGNNHINRSPFQLNVSTIMPLLEGDSYTDDETFYFLIKNKYFGIILSEKDDDNDTYFYHSLSPHN